MGHLVSKEQWGVVDLDLEKSHVFVREDWHYRWRFQMIMRPWSDAEKLAFHQAVDRQVWRSWSMRARFMVTSKGDRAVGATAHAFMRKCGSRGVTLSFDVRRVEGVGHWHVNVYKLSLDQDKRADVDILNRAINLYIEDVAPSSAVNEAGAVTPSFLTVPHEFGHTLAANDEYEKTSPHLRDNRSLMNIGSQVRSRHVGLLSATLERMMPGCAFRAMA
jgi:hypothetical protein